MDSNHTPKQTFPLWKWILELVLGSILFAILYGLGMGMLSIPQPTAKCAAILLSAAVILAMFPLWIKLFEKQWCWDLLSRHAGKNIFCGISLGFLFLVVLSGILYVTGCYSAQYASPHWSYILVNLSFYFLVACGEEVIFRGIIFRMIDDRFGLWWALGISGLKSPEGTAPEVRNAPNRGRRRTSAWVKEPEGDEQTHFWVISFVGPRALLKRCFALAKLV